MKKTKLLAASLLMAPLLHAQTKSDYNAAIVKFSRYYNAKQADSLYAMCSEKIQKVSPPDKTAQMMEQLYGKLGEMKNFAYSNEKDNFTFYKTEFTNGTVSLVVALNKENQLETFRFLPYKDEAKDDAGKKEPSNFTCKSGKATIYGTLTVPATSGKVPVVLLIAGSGPTDRDGNQGGEIRTNCYAMLADSLQKAGIACLRFDKRGVGESIDATTQEETMSFEDMISDAAGCIRKLKEDPRFSKVVVVGHSEGSLIGMIAASREKAGAYISVAGAGERIDKIVERQLGAQSKQSAVGATIIFDSLAKGFTVKHVDSSFGSLFRPSIQPYLISWLKYDPSKEIRKLKIPVMLIQGTTDIQVAINDAEQLKKALPAAQLTIVKGMSHILKDGPTDRQQNFATYSQPNLPLNASFVKETVRFIKKANG